MKIFLLTLFALLTIIVSSCEEGTTKIGTGLLPTGDYVSINSTDTIDAWSYTMYDDSVRSENPSISYLGEIYDPYFGTTSAEFVTQIRLGGAWDDKPFTIDSVRLFLTLLDVRGAGTNEIHMLNLYEIAEKIYTDSTYYSNKTVPLTEYEFTDIELPVLKPDTINRIIVNLPLEFGQHIVRDTSMLFYSNTKDDFRTYFKGLYFRLSTGVDPLLISLSLEPPPTIGSYNNLLVLYMHNEADAPKQYVFVLDAMNRNAGYNIFSHDFSTASLGSIMSHLNDESYRDTVSYLQSLNGVFTKIKLPGLENLKNDPSFDNIVVNKARLIIPAFFDGNNYSPTTAPGQLYLRYRTNSGYKYFIPDYDIDRYHLFFDGTFDESTNLYNFNLPAFVQAYLDDKTDELKPELEVFQSTVTSNVILKANYNTSPINFEFTYTKF